MQYKPYQFNMGTFNVINEELLIGSSRDGSGLNQDTVRLAVDFHCQRASRNFNKYVGVAKDRIKNGSVIDGNSAAGSGNSRWLSSDAGSSYSHGHTHFVAQNIGVISP